MSVVLQRCTSADPLSARAVVARTGMIEDVSKRASPDGPATCTCRGDRRRVFLHRTVLGWMSALLITVVIVVLVLSEKVFKFGDVQASAEVLAIVLTLFSAIQAGASSARTGRRYAAG